MANNFNLGVDEDDIKKLLEQLKLEQECIAEEEAREKKTTGEVKEEPPRKFTVKGLVNFQNSTSLKSLKTRTLTPKGFH